MKLKKLLALALAGVITAATLTACTPLDAAELVYDSIFGGGSSSTGSTGSAAEDAENRAVAVGVADCFKENSQSVEVSYSVPELTSTIRPAFTPEWFKKDGAGNISGLNRNFHINSALTLDQFLGNSLKDYCVQTNYVGFFAFESTGMSASEQAEQFKNINSVPKVGVQLPFGSPAPTKLRVGVCHKTVEGREYCLVVVVGTC
ncbi:MAG: hypothetical protein KH336_07865 [Faecalibacterium prausnitzii]|nr:hypothetical protein [Faecalibacterium prausnitzii]